MEKLELWVEKGKGGAGEIKEWKGRERNRGGGGGEVWGSGFGERGKWLEKEWNKRRGIFLIFLRFFTQKKRGVEMIL